jgi:prophage maintenance system killer protein
MKIFFDENISLVDYKYMFNKEYQDYINVLLPTLISLEQYDKGAINLKDKSKEKYKIHLELFQELINKTKTSLTESGEKINFFGIDNNNGLKNVIDTLYSTYDNIELYPFFEDKASNLLYLITKDRPFVDGNKRIGTLLYRFYCILNGYDVVINPQLPLFVAESNPKDKDLIIDLIISSLQQSKKSN